MNSIAEILKDLRFGFLGDYAVAGMGEPWLDKLDGTHELLREQGIGAILTLTEDDLFGSLHEAAGFCHCHEPIDDCEPPDINGMDRAIDFIDRCLRKNMGVAVHCFEGRGRTGTVLAAWLARQEMLTAECAISRVRTLRYQTALTESQKAFLIRYLDGTSDKNN